MIAFFLALLFAQGIPALPGQSGSVTGVLRTSAGAAAAGVRVSVMVPPESDVDVRSAAAFVALAETDSEGRFRLEGIPQGRYYLVAGRVDLPTFFPGTTDLAKARIFSITPGIALSGMDFVMMDSSVRSLQPVNDLSGIFAALSLQLSVPRLRIPAQALVEGGGAVPVFAGGGFTRVRLTDPVGGSLITMPLTGSALEFPIPSGLSPPEYRVSVDNLPEGYFVKSMTFGPDDVNTGTLKIPAANVPRTVVMTVAGITQQVFIQVAPNGAPMPTLIITLSKFGPSPVAGVRVSGRAKDTEVRSIYLSGVPGTLYADGTFEFRGVPPGWHPIAALGNPPALASLAASIVVGDHDVDNVELQATAALPVNMKVPAPAGPPGDHSPGTILALGTLRGRAVEERSGQPIAEGTIKLVGRDEAVAPIGTDGQYEFPKLLPGSYEIDMQIFGHAMIHQTVIMGEDDVALDLKTLKLY